MFYASINMSPTNSIWGDAGELFRYITRCQAFLSAGEPDNDFLLYFPLEDIWYEQNGAPYLMFDIHKMDQRMPEVKRAVNEIINAGYDVDYVSDKLLETLKVNPDGTVSGEGNARYKAVVIPPVKLMQPSTLSHILSLAEQGATVVFTGSQPKDVPGLGHLDERRKEFKKLATRLPGESATPRSVNAGNGRFITGPDFASTLSLTGVKPETLRTVNHAMIIRRTNEVGGHNYFIAMLTNSPIDGWVKLATDASAAEIFNPVTGEAGMAQLRKDDTGNTLVRLQLAPGESLLLKTFPSAGIAMAPWRYIESQGSPVALANGWKISFPESQPAISGEFVTDTLTHWCNLPVPEAKVNTGTARYSVDFNLDNPSVADEWMLDLGDVRESARVYVNGEYAGTAWSVPFRLNIGKWLRQGNNHLDIDVTNLQANRIADYERRGVKWRIFKDANIASVTNERKFSFGDWETVPSGLNSSVSLVPLTLTKY